MIMSRGRQVSDLKEYFSQINSYPLLSHEDEIELGRRKDEGDPEARERLINSNLRLVVYVSNRYKNRGLELADLIEAGNIGLILGTENYDYRIGRRFSTYVGWWIKRKILREIAENAYFIRIPEGTQEQIKKGSGLDNDLSEEELYEKRVFVEQVQRNKKIRSINSREGNKIAVLDGPHYDQEDLLRKIHELVYDTDILDEREREILTHRFGFDGKDPMTLEEIKEEIGNISREHVRQIEHKAREKLRKSRALSQLAT